MECNSKELRIGNNVFTFHDELMRKNRAKKVCRKEDMNLASLHDQNTIEKISDHIIKCFIKSSNGWHVAGLDKKNKSFTDGVKFTKKMKNLFVDGCQSKTTSEKDQNVILNPFVKKLSILKKHDRCGAVGDDKQIYKKFNYICMKENDPNFEKLNDNPANLTEGTTEPSSVHTTSSETTTPQDTPTEDTSKSNFPNSGTPTNNIPTISTTRTNNTSNQGKFENLPKYVIYGGGGLALVVVLLVIVLFADFVCKRMKRKRRNDL